MLLTRSYAANRLYLVYHNELTPDDARLVFGWWRQHCPPHVRLVPTVVLCMYDEQLSPVFTPDELLRMVEFFRTSINRTQLAVYDVYAERDQGELLEYLAQ